MLLPISGALEPSLIQRLEPGPWEVNKESSRERVGHGAAEGTQGCSGLPKAVAASVDEAMAKLWDFLWWWAFPWHSVARLHGLWFPQVLQRDASFYVFVLLRPLSVMTLGFDCRRRIRICCDELNLLVPFCNAETDKATTLQWTTAFLKYIQERHGDSLKKVSGRPGRFPEFYKFFLSMSLFFPKDNSDYP